MAAAFLSPCQQAKAILENDSDPGDKLGFDPQPYFQQFVRTGIKPQTVPFARLHIDLLDDYAKKHQYRYGLCAYRFDVQFYFVLTYRTREGKLFGLALLGFAFKRNHTFYISQLQGLGFKRCDPYLRQILRSLRWEKLLITIAEKWAAGLGFKRVAILKAKYNEYYHSPPKNSEKARLNQRLVMHYDITAQRMGYRNSSWRSCYHYKNLKTP